MRISSLQIALVIAGVLFVVGVILYNQWVLRRARGRERAAAPHAGAGDERLAPRLEPSLRAPGAAPHPATAAPAAPAGAFAARSAAESGDGPGLAGLPDIAPPAAPAADDGASGAGEAEEPASPHPPDAPLPALPVVKREAQDVTPDRRDTTLAQPDPDIESVVALRPAAPLGVNALAGGLHARIGKPLRWFGRRDERAGWQRLHAETSGEFAEVVACLLLADRNGAITRNQLETCFRMLRELAPTLPATLVAPSIDDELARAEALDKLCAELDVQIGVTLQKVDGSSIAGTRLRGVAEAAGFRLAPNGRFEWVQEETGNVVYSMQSIDGTPFSLEQLRAAALAGVVFVLDVPCVADAPRAFDQMRLAAARLAHTLGAEIVDDNRRPLDDAALARTRAAVVAAAAALVEVHIEPGSPRALKLFSA